GRPEEKKIWACFHLGPAFVRIQFVNLPERTKVTRPHPRETLAPNRDPLPHAVTTIPPRVTADLLPMTQKKRPRRRRSPREGPSRRRRGEEGASLSGSLVESDSSSTTSSAPPSGSFDKPAGRTSSAPPSGSLDEPPVAWPARQSRYHEILASRLVRLQLQAGVAIDSPNLPSDQIVQVLARSNFYDDELRAALVEYQVHKFLSEPHGPDVGDTHFGEDSGDDITAEEFVKYSGQLKTRRPAEIDTKTGLDQEQLDSLLAKYKRYRFKAYLLLLGKPVDELEEAALESKYPMELALENDFFYPCHHDSAFGWYFDSDLCLLANLSDYQRLVLPNRVSISVYSQL
uniref:Uncharacterized protein n=1 Tax=Aegilops tauschii subsp. strangulata TaxID=200361 RepID=A0A452XE96_AEGTS